MAFNCNSKWVAVETPSSLSLPNIAHSGYPYPFRAIRHQFDSTRVDRALKFTCPCLFICSIQRPNSLSLLSLTSGGWCGSVPSCSKRAACGSLPSAVLGHNNGYIGSGYRLLLTSNIFHLVGDLCGHSFVCGGGCRVCVCEWPYQVAINNFPIILWVLSVTARMRQ